RGVGGAANRAGFGGSTAVGAGATKTAGNQMMFGTASTTYAAPGITSAASRAAQSGPTQFVTSDASGNLATSNFGPQDIAVLKQDMVKAFEGTAVAIALGGTALPSDKRFAISTNWGNFRGQNAMSFAGQMRLNEAIVVNAGIAAGLQHSGIGSRVGATLAW